MAGGGCSHTPTASRRLSCRPPPPPPASPAPPPRLEEALMSSRSTRRRVARSLAVAIAVCAVATPVATAAAIDTGLHLRGHGAAQTIRSQPVATSFVLADRATPQAAPPVRTPPAPRS